MNGQVDISMVHPGCRVARAARLGEPDELLSAGRKILGGDALAAAMCGEGIAAAILSCRPRAAAALAHVLRQLAVAFGGPQSPLLMHAVFRTPPGGPSVKVMSALAEAGFDLRAVRQLPAHPALVRAHRDHLLGLQKGSQDASDGAVSEPDLADLLTRPWFKPFHGRNYSRFPGDLTLWQPLVHGHWGAPWALAPSAGIVATLAAVLAMIGQAL